MGNNKKILVFHHSGAIGGGGVSMLHILKSIKECGYDIKVICPDEPSYMMDEIKDLGISVDGTFDKDWVYPHFNGQHYSTLDPRYIKRWSYIKRSKAKITDMISKEAPDIVIFNSMTIAWMNSCVPEGIKTICFDRETFPREGKGYRSRRIKKWLSRMTKSVFLSEYDKDIAGNHDNFLVITDKVDLNQYRNKLDDVAAGCSRHLNFDRRTILFCGGMWHIKGSHTVLNMMHHLNDGYQLIFMQYTPSEKTWSVKSAIRSMLGMDYEEDTIELLKGIEDRVKFFEPQSDIAPFFTISDIVVFPSCEPHQARPVYEAGASCKPCVISDYPNTAEFAKDGVNVLTFKPDDARDLARCIERLCDRELYYKLADNGLKMCAENHNIETLSDEIKDLLKSIEE